MAVALDIRDYTYSGPLGTSLGDIIRKEAPDLYHANSSLKDFLLATHSAEFEKREPDALRRARREMGRLEQADVDWLLVSTIQEGLGKHGASLLRLNVLRDVLLGRATPQAIGGAANVIIERLNSDPASHQHPFATRSLREVLKAFPRESDVKLEALSTKSAQALINDILEKCGHPDLDPKSVPPLSRLLHMAVEHIKNASGNDSPILAGYARLAHRELTEERRYNQKKHDSYSGFDYGGFDDLDFGLGYGRESRKPRERKPRTADNTDEVTLLEKVVDDLGALMMSDRSRFWVPDSDADAAKAAWKRWASQRQARASVYMLLIGEAGVAAELPDRERYVETLKECIRLPNKPLAGCGMSALGTLVQSLSFAEQLDWLIEVQDIKSSSRRRDDGKEWEAKGAWADVRADMDLGLRKVPGEDLELSTLTRYLTDKHPKVRKAAFGRLQELLDAAEAKEKFELLRSTGLLTEFPFGSNARPSYPWKAAGRMADILIKYADQFEETGKRQATEYAWAGIAIAANGERARARVNMPPLDASIAEVVPRALSWPEEQVTKLSARMLERLGKKLLFTDAVINPIEKLAISRGVLRLLPKVRPDRRERFLEKLLADQVPVEAVIENLPPGEKDAVAEAARPHLERLGKHRHVLALCEHASDLERKRMRDVGIRGFWRMDSTERAELVKPQHDARTEELASLCNVDDVRYLVARCTTPGARSREDAFLEHDTDSSLEISKLLGGFKTIVELGKGLEAEAYLPILAELEAVVLAPDGERGQYGNLSDRRERAMKMHHMLAVKFVNTPSQDTVLASVKKMVGSSEEAVAFQSLSGLIQFVDLLLEPKWSEISEEVRKINPVHAERIRYVVHFAVKATDPAVRTFHMDLLVEGLRSGGHIREDFEHHIAPLLKALPKDEANRFLDRVIGEISARSGSREAHRWTLLRLEEQRRKE